MIKDIFIVHWKELKERKEYLESQFGNYNVTWVDFFDRNTITKSMIDDIYKKDPDIWNNRVKDLYNNPPEYRELKMSEICNAMSHVYIVRYVCEFGELDQVLVLEDDVVLNPNFFINFDFCFNQTPKDFDIIFFGSAFSAQILDSVGFENYKPAIQIQNGIVVYEKFRNPKTRTVDAYILSKSACFKLINVIDNISLPYDFDLAYFIKELDLKVYWWEPGLVFQGSQSGRYKSSIR